MLSSASGPSSCASELSSAGSAPTLPSRRSTEPRAALVEARASKCRSDSRSSLKPGEGGRCQVGCLSWKKRAVCFVWYSGTVSPVRGSCATRTGDGDRARDRDCASARVRPLGEPSPATGTSMPSSAAAVEAAWRSSSSSCAGCQAPPGDVTGGDGERAPSCVRDRDGCTRRATTVESSSGYKRGTGTSSPASRSRGCPILACRAAGEPGRGDVVGVEGAGACKAWRGQKAAMGHDYRWVRKRRTDPQELAGVRDVGPAKQVSQQRHRQAARVGRVVLAHAVARSRIRCRESAIRLGIGRRGACLSRTRLIHLHERAPEEHALA